MPTGKNTYKNSSGSSSKEKKKPSEQSGAQEPFRASCRKEVLMEFSQNEHDSCTGIPRSKWMAFLISCLSYVLWNVKYLPLGRFSPKSTGRQVSSKYMNRIDR